MPSLPRALRWKDNVTIERGKFEQVLDACLDQVLHKGGSLELCLAKMGLLKSRSAEIGLLELRLKKNRPMKPRPDKHSFVKACLREIGSVQPAFL